MTDQKTATRMFIRYLFKVASDHLEQLRLTLDRFLKSEYSKNILELEDSLCDIIEAIILEMDSQPMTNEEDEND